MSDEPSSAQAGTRSRILNTVQEKAQEVLHEDFGKARELVGDAAKSQAYLYPIKGIFYFATHRSLWKPLVSKLVPYFTLSAGVVAGMFAFTYVPQLAVLVFVNGPLAIFTTVLLILNESAAIINIISRNFLLDEALLDTFDAVLLAKNSEGLVKEGREVRPGRDPMQKLGKVLKSPFQKYSLKAFVRYLVYLPLNFIPIVGTVIFILVQGRTRGQNVHGRYFQLKKWSASQQSDWMKKHTGPYTSFGLVATVLELVPFASMVFTFTSTVGAALWAADLEAKQSSMTGGTAPSLREAAKKAE